MWSILISQKVLMNTSIALGALGVLATEARPPAFTTRSKTAHWLEILSKYSNNNMKCCQQCASLCVQGGTRDSRLLGVGLVWRWRRPIPSRLWWP
uniref:Secreted protein n=1 Tax=Timema genevievae TaxID=629358 RepID=A0A7R9PRD2_TIMGE|nr:unnamed protein product [Timema genevievae]